MYYQEGGFDGSLQAAGGFGTAEYGAAGTVFVEKRITSSDVPFRTLTVDNKGRSPSTSQVVKVGN